MATSDLGVSQPCDEDNFADVADWFARRAACRVTRQAALDREQKAFADTAEAEKRIEALSKLATHNAVQAYLEGSEPPALTVSERKNLSRWKGVRDAAVGALPHIQAAKELADAALGEAEAETTPALDLVGRQITSATAAIKLALDQAAPALAALIAADRLRERLIGATFVTDRADHPGLASGGMIANRFLTNLPDALKVPSLQPSAIDDLAKALVVDVLSKLKLGDLT